MDRTTGETDRAGELRAELDALLAEAPDLAGLLYPQPGEPELPEYVLLREGPPPYYVIRIPLPERQGALWVSRLPGFWPSATEGEIDALVRLGVERVVCLVSSSSLVELHGAERYLKQARARFGDRFMQIEIPDHRIPPEDDPFERAVIDIDEALGRGEQVLVHCVGGCGRTGTFVACLLVRHGLGAGEAIRAFRRRRRCGPETTDQIAYVARYETRARGALRGARGVRPIVRVAIVRAKDGKGPHVLARGGLADILQGRAHFAGGGSRRVAIKVPRAPLNDVEARELQGRIDALSSAGVRLPRMCVMHIPAHGWVIVAALFGATSRGSKFIQPSLFYRDLPGSEKAFVAGQLARVASAGYLPSIDLFVIFKDTPHRAMPVDLDLVTRGAEASCVRKLALCIIQMGDDPGERLALREAALAAAAPPIRQALRELFDAPASQFAVYFASSAS